MGTCRSSCSHSTALEYYDGWRKDQVVQRRRGGHGRSTIVIDRAKPQRGNASKRSRQPTKIWVCDRGCCSIRWKLDYAEFQSYSKYAEISPYVVVQEGNAGCRCLICKGLPEAFVAQSRSIDVGTKQVEQHPEATPSDTDEDEEEDGDQLPRRRVQLVLPRMASPVA